MPSEFLRDVLRTGDSASRTRRRWFLFPVSLAVHAVAAIAYLIIPLAAEVSLPVPAPLFASRHWTMPVAPPTTPPAPAPGARVRDSLDRSAAPREAPPRLISEIPSIAASPVPGGLDLPGALAIVPGVLTGEARPLPPAALPAPATVDRQPLKVGGSIRAPQRLSASSPIYPAMAISARVEGLVVLEALIDERGRVDDVRVLKSVPLLDAAAASAVRTWRYTPTLLNGVPVPVLMTVTVRFNLQR